MFRPVSLFIGLRYTRAKRRNHFISFISLTSMLGIALGVTALITVLSVMNGFDHEIRSRVFGMARQVTVTTTSGSLADWPSLQNYMTHFPGVTGVAPLVNSQGMLSYQGLVQPVNITGILPDQEAKVSQISESNSLAQTKLNPAFLKPRSKPPAPAKRETIFINVNYTN